MAERSALATVSAESTIRVPVPIVARSASFRTGKCVQPSTRVSGAELLLRSLASCHLDDLALIHVDMAECTEAELAGCEVPKGAADPELSGEL